MQQSQNYQYSSQPRPVGAKRTKYRDPDANDEKPLPQNIMFDRRVVRGSTYAKNRNQTTGPVQQRQPKQQTRKKTQVRPGTPPAVDGRQHMDVQTDTYLEELTDRVPEVEEGTQTDAYLDRPPPPVFMPIKTGIDVCTQIQDGDLFDFDLEVEPILEVLVGKTLEVSMMEVLEDEELSEIRAHQEQFEQARNAELAEVQRLEAEALRKNCEKERRYQEEKERLVAQTALQEKVAARAFAKQCISGLHSSVFSNLMASGHFYDPVHKEVSENFMPFLLQSACAQVEQVAIARTLATSLVTHALSNPNGSSA